MKKLLCCVLRVLLIAYCITIGIYKFPSMTAILAADAISRPVPRNPVIADYGENVLFYMSFDDGSTQPDIGRINGKDINVTIADDGFLGKGLATGAIRFELEHQQSIVDFTRPGTMLVWIKTNLDPPKTNRFEPAFTYFIAHWKGEWKRLIGVKPTGSLWGHGKMGVYYERNIKNKRERGRAECSVQAADWKAGTWRLFVVTWTVDKLGFSVDGNPLHYGSYNTRLGPLVGRLEWIAGKGPKPFYMLDECVILDKALTNAEIKSIYEKSLNERRKLCLQQH